MTTGMAATEELLTILGPESEQIQQLVRRTGYPLKQENGQRRYGPPPDWGDAAAPGRGCEVFVGKLPRDCFENELVPVFQRFGRIYEVWISLLDSFVDERSWPTFAGFAGYIRPREMLMELQSGATF